MMKTKKKNKWAKAPNGGRSRKLLDAKKLNGDDEVVPVDKFIDDSTPVEIGSAYAPPATEDDVKDELSQLGGYRDFLNENRSSLTYGDY